MMRRIVSTFVVAALAAPLLGCAVRARPAYVASCGPGWHWDHGCRRNVVYVRDHRW
jgi:hypothetical protein